MTWWCIPRHARLPVHLAREAGWVIARPDALRELASTDYHRTEKLVELVTAVMREGVLPYLSPAYVAFCLPGGAPEGRAWLKARGFDPDKEGVFSLPQDAMYELLGVERGDEMILYPRPPVQPPSLRRPPPPLARHLEQKARARGRGLLEVFQPPAGSAEGGK